VFTALSLGQRNMDAQMPGVRVHAVQCVAPAVLRQRSLQPPAWAVSDLAAGHEAAWRQRATNMLQLRGPGSATRSRERCVRLGMPPLRRQMETRLLPRRAFCGSSCGRPSMPRWRGNPIGQLRVGFTGLVRQLTGQPRILIVEIATIVLLSACFEWFEHKARHKFTSRGRETALQFLEAFFKEVTVLGFVFLVLFILSHTGTCDKIGRRILVHGTFSGHDPLCETLETVHMMIFFLLMVLLAQVAILFTVSATITTDWTQFERLVAYGTAKGSLESRFVQAGYLERRPSPEDPQSYVLMNRQPYVFGRQASLYRASAHDKSLRRIVQWRALRHNFLFATHWDSYRIRGMLDPSLFNFEKYLRPIMSKVVLSVIHIDRFTWIITLVLLVGPFYARRLCPWLPKEVLVCILVWLLALAGFAMARTLQKEVMHMTPQVPREASSILHVFSDESIQMLRRRRLPGWSSQPGLEVNSEAKLGAPISLESTFSSKTYTALFRILSLLQAASVTFLLLSHMSISPLGGWRTCLTILAWAEWPLMLFVIVPTIIRTLTLFMVIVSNKDPELIRQVNLESKLSNLRDYVRLLQLAGFAGRMLPVLQSSKRWKGQQSAIAFIIQGLRKWEAMPEDDKEEIVLLFEAWDGAATGSMETRELVEAFASMGTSDPQALVTSLMALVDYDGVNRLTLMKFKALVGMAVGDAMPEERKLDILRAFAALDTQNSGSLSAFEVADGLRSMHVGVDREDVYHLLLLHFGVAKPYVTPYEFVEWLLANGEPVD